jgi:hypothetical protein
MSTQPPIVVQLQALAIDESTDVSQLLRQAMVIATKLGLTDFNAWVREELHGYESVEDLPRYAL